MTEYTRWRAHVLCTLTVGLLAMGLLWGPTNVLAASGGPQGYHGKACPTVHHIALGENLTWIAAEYGVTVEALIEENGIDDANLIVEHQALCIPARSRGSLSEWGSYGIPGHSYDPNWVKQQTGDNQSGYNVPSSSANNTSWQPTTDNSPGDAAPSYHAPGKAGTTYVAPAAPKSSGYWKDDLRYPYAGTSTSVTDEIGPDEEDTPEMPDDPMEPDEPNGEIPDEG